MSHPIIESQTITPGWVNPGDVIADMGNTRSVVVKQVRPIKIWYRARPVMVWLIKGNYDGFGRGPFVTVCLPRQPWYLVRRKQA